MINKFKTEQIFKLSTKNIDKLKKYIVSKCSHLNLEDAINNIIFCPFCNSLCFEETSDNPKLYKCHKCTKTFNIFDIVSFYLKLENVYLKFTPIYNHKLQNKYCNINNIVHFGLKHQILQLSQIFKNNHISNISINTKKDLPYNYKYKKPKKDLIITINGGIYKNKVSISEFSKKSMPSTRSPRQFDTDKKVKQEYISEYKKLKNDLKLIFSKFTEDEYPKLTDIKYKRIRKLKDTEYNFTHMVVYEMAIRNENVKTLFRLTSYLKYISNNRNQEAIHRLFRSYICLKDHNTCVKLQFDVIKSLIYEYEQELITTYMVYPSYYKHKAKEENMYIVKNILNNEPTKPKKFHSNTKYIDGITISQASTDSEDGYNINIINLNHKTNIIDNNEALVSLNLNLSLEELTKQIEHIKNTLYKDSSQPSEHLLSLLALKGNNVKKATKHTGYPEKLNIKTMVYLFFIYDYVTFYIKKYTVLNSEEQETENSVDTRIKKAVQSLNQSSNIKYTTKTIKRYYESMRNYIEECEYKVLLSGVNIT